MNKGMEMHSVSVSPTKIQSTKLLHNMTSQIHFGSNSSFF